jgi:delta 1-pyrroline-5-carboxylate dehydrogenase
VNRNAVGAVVGLQPFGGEGLSGTGTKAGGPNYLQRFMVERMLTINETAWGVQSDFCRVNAKKYLMASCVLAVVRSPIIPNHSPATNSRNRFIYQLLTRGLI